jgi:hypothetical protein
MNAHPSKRFARIAAVVVAGAVVGVGGAALVVAADEPSHAPANGQIPADLFVWAEQNHVSGLSPASARVATNSFQYDASYGRTMQQLADWARNEGLSGLSPLSLQPVTTDGQ